MQELRPRATARVCPKFADAMVLCEDEEEGGRHTAIKRSLFSHGYFTSEDMATALVRADVESLIPFA